MTFLHHVFLYALAASLIPFLLYLLSRTRLPEVPFPSLVFLRKLQQTQARKVWWRQILLLIIRALVVAALVMVFARPLLPTAPGSGGGASAEIAVLVDDGLHSSVISTYGAIAHRQKEIVETLVEHSGEDDRITLISLAQPQIKERGTSRLKTPLLDWNAQWEPKPLIPNLSSAFLYADSLLSHSLLPNREIWLISPFYSSIWDSIPYQPRHSRILLVPSGPKQVDNLAIRNVTMTSTLLMPGKAVELVIEVVNESDREVEEAILSLYLEGERVNQASVNLPPRSTKAVKTTLNISRGGSQAGWVLLEEADGLAWDNRYYFVLPVPQQIKALIVSPPGLETQALQAALNSAGGLFQVTTVPPARWEALSLKEYDLFILVGVGQVSLSAQERISRLVEEGRGVLIFPSTQMDLGSASRGLWTRLGFQGALGPTGSRGVRWSNLDLNHPLFEGVFEGNREPQSPRFDWFLQLVASADDEIVIALSDGNPFLLSRKVGKGRALLFAGALSPTITDWIYSGIFAPLMVRSSIWAVSRAGEISAGWHPGPPQVITLAEPLDKECSWVSPSGEKVIASPRQSSWGTEISTPFLMELGIWTLYSKEEVVGKWAVNLPPHFSSLKRGQIFNQKTNSSVVVIEVDRAEELPQKLRQLRRGRELWQSFWGAFLGFLLVEMILARPRRKEMSG